MKSIISCIIIYFFCNLQFVSSNLCFDVICIPAEYNKLINPLPENETTTVHVDFRRIQILRIDENESTITLKLTVLMFWFEPRIFISSNATEEDKKKIKWSKEKRSKILPKEFVNHLWVPNAYIPRVHKINKYNFFHDFETYLYGLDSLGRNIVGCQIDVEIVLFCKMNFTDYPMDENTCYFTLGSYEPISYGERFKLLNLPNISINPLEFDASQQIAQLDFTIDVKELPKRMEKSKDSFGTYQRTGFEIKFERKFSRFLTDYYFPSGILVALSWVSKFYYHYFQV